MPEINSRELVMDMLLEVLREGTHSHILIKNVLDKYNYIQESDKAFIKRLFEGTLERMITIDYIINRFSNTPVNKMKPLIRCLMRMSVYQIVYMDRIPDSAAINEAVKLAKKRKFVNLSGFVNGVLRNISRNKEQVLDTEEWSVVYSCPQLIVDGLIADYGEEAAKQVLKSTLSSRTLSVRVREDIESQELVFEEWKSSGIEYVQSDRLKNAYALSGNTEAMAGLCSFRNGLFTVQDESSQLVVETADIAAGMQVLDICAAPGGKTMQALGKGAKVSARDVSDRKVALIIENAERMGYSLDTRVWDATVLDEECIDKYDVVIADVPCSGWGVMSKKPDIKYGVTSDALESLEQLQRDIIDNAVRYVKAGGTLMYSTCTLRKNENQKQREYIVSRGYTLVEEETVLASDAHDGFYIAKLKRND